MADGLGIGFGLASSKSGGEMQRVSRAPLTAPWPGSRLITLKRWGR